MDCESVDIYPVGWGELVGHKLEGPRQAVPLKKEKKKPVGKRGKKRAHGNGPASPGSGLSQVSTVWTVNDVLVDPYPFIILVDPYPFRALKGYRLTRTSLTIRVLSMYLAKLT